MGTCKDCSHYRENYGFGKYTVCRRDEFSQGRVYTTYPERKACACFLELTPFEKLCEEESQHDKNRNTKGN